MSHWPRPRDLTLVQQGRLKVCDLLVLSVIIVTAVALFIHFNVKVQFLDSAEYRAMAEEYLTNRRTVNSLFSFVWPHGNAQQQQPQQQSNQQTQQAAPEQPQPQGGSRLMDQPQPTEASAAANEAQDAVASNV